MSASQKTKRYERRHSRWYEICVLSALSQIVFGVIIVVLIPILVRWGTTVWTNIDAVRANTIWAVALPFIASIVLLRRLGRFSGGIAAANIIPIVTFLFLLSFAIILFGRLDYSRSVLFIGYGLSLGWCFISYFVDQRYMDQKLAALPLGRSAHLRSTRRVKVRVLQTPALGRTRYDGIVADLRSAAMTPQWERFLAECILAKIPVFHVRQAEEAMTGRVYIDHLSENAVGALLPSRLYSGVKRVIDIIGAVATLALTLPLMLLAAIAIKIDSKGPALFMQHRVGLGNRDFRMYKLRSMHIDADADGARMAREDDDRITRVGRFIRKARIDELPQLWNVIKGEMSLIGPRPEQRDLVERFNVEIPFYLYRHVVRPGITGWAQITQGYAGDEEQTHIKIQHDFYYIKHFSLWLDILIVFKTFKVLRTGQGAR